MTPNAELSAALVAVADCLERRHLVGVREREVLAQARAALARKPRNSDRFPDEKSAWKEYNAIPRAYRSPAPYVEWLFEEVDA